MQEEDTDKNKKTASASELIWKLTSPPEPISKLQFFAYIASTCKLTVKQLQGFGLEAYKCLCCGDSHCLGWVLEDKAKMDRK